MWVWWPAHRHAEKSVFCPFSVPFRQDLSLNPDRGEYPENPNHSPVSYQVHLSMLDFFFYVGAGIRTQALMPIHQLLSPIETYS